MSTINHNNIIVEGVPYSKIIELFISHAPNVHGRAKIVGEISHEEADDFVQRVDETFGISIVTSAEGQPKRLFYGMVAGTNLERLTEYSLLTIDLETVSNKLDAQKKNRTFQSTTKTYSQILNSLDTVQRSNGTVQVMVTDKPIGSLIMQYTETDWEFIIRMAAQLGALAFENIIAKSPQVYIGLPPSSQAKTIQTVQYDHGRSETAFQSLTSNTPSAASSMREDFATEVVRSYDYVYLGDTVTLNGKSLRVKAVNAQLVDGILECTYYFALKSGFAAPAIMNKMASGRMMTGIVKNVEADRVQVFLNTIDESYDSGGDWWFPYSTAYSSQDGSGWYSMPAVGDQVRVFFPSDHEGEAFAASSVAKHVRPKITDKCWRGVNGKQLLMTEEGLIIICKDQKIYINLTDEKGIEIISDMDINITSGTRINVQAGEEIKVIAKNEVVVGTASSYLDIRNDGIIASAKKIIVT